jgi:Mn2+/Fe2+ NRAMP family transporter
MFVSQVVNGILLPFVLIFMLVLINRKKLMGDAVNGPIFNVIAWATVISMIVLTLMLVATSFGVRIGSS